MRSLIAVEHQAALHKQAVLRETLASTRRVDLLAQRIAMHIESLVPQGGARCLDIGGDPALAEAVQEHARHTDWRCIGVHALTAEVRNGDGRIVPSEEREFDVALICDVLNRLPQNGAQLLEAAGRVAKRVLVKDYFEHASYSRTMLRPRGLADNRGEGGSVPQHYFTPESFTRLTKELRFVITAFDGGLSLSEQAPVARTTLRPDSEFIAVLRRGG